MESLVKKKDRVDLRVNKLLKKKAAIDRRIRDLSSQKIKHNRRTVAFRKKQAILIKRAGYLNREINKLKGNQV